MPTNWTKRTALGPAVGADRRWPGHGSHGRADPRRSCDNRQRPDGSDGRRRRQDACPAHLYRFRANAGKVLRISHPLGEQGSLAARRRSGESGRDYRRSHAADGAKLSRCALARRIAGDADRGGRVRHARRGRGPTHRSRARVRAQRTQTSGSAGTHRDRFLKGAWKRRGSTSVTNEAALASAKAQHDVRRSERASVAARLINP